MGFTVGKGIDKYIKMLGNLENDAPEAMGHAIYEGAKIVADEIHASIQSLPVGEPRQGKVTRPQKAGLLEGLGIASQRNDSGFWNVKIGMDGYNSTVNKHFPKGQPNAMIARSLEKGSSKYPKHPFIAPAVRRSRARAEQKMAMVIDERVYAIMKD